VTSQNERKVRTGMERFKSILGEESRPTKELQIWEFRRLIRKGGGAVVELT